MAVFPTPGFRPVIRDGGGPFSLTQYAKPATDAVPITHFDMVMKVAGAAVLNDQPNFNIPTIQSASAGTPGTTLWLGSNFGFGPKSTLSMHSVADEIDCIFFATASSLSPGTTAAFAGKNCNIQPTVPAGPRWQSKMFVNTAGVAADPALDVRIRALAMNLTSYDGALGAWLEVTINKHFYAQGSPGI